MASQNEIITISDYNGWVSRVNAVYKNHHNGSTYSPLSEIGQYEKMSLVQINKLLTYGMNFADKTYQYLGTKIVDSSKTGVIINSDLISSINSKLTEWEAKDNTIKNTFYWTSYMNDYNLYKSYSESENTCYLQYRNEGYNSKFMIECYTDKLSDFVFRFSSWDGYGGRVSITDDCYIHFIDDMYEDAYTMSLSGNDYIEFYSSDVIDVPIYGFYVNNKQSGLSLNKDSFVGVLPIGINIKFEFEERSVKWNDPTKKAQKLHIEENESYITDY